jgi:hypothetical protein
MNSPFMSIKYNIILQFQQGGQLFSFVFPYFFSFFFTEIDYAYTIFAIIINVLTFLKHKNKHVLIRKFNVTSNKKKLLSSPNFCTI